MDKISMTLTVYFEEGFWHGLFEQEHAQSYRVCRVTFGAEPSTQELLDFLNRYYHRLQFSPSIRVMREKTKSVSPKRLQRQAKKEQLASRSSKSQEALKLQFEEQKKIAQVKRKQQKELAKQRKFELKQQKRLEKHKGH